jgi:hypothetical protein
MATVGTTFEGMSVSVRIMRVAASSCVALLVASCGAPHDATAPGVNGRRAAASSELAPDASTPPSPVASAQLKPPASATPGPTASPEPESASYVPPEGFVYVPGIFDEPEGTSKSALCGALKVENVRGDPNVFEPYVVVTDTKTGKKIYEAHGRRYDLGGVKPSLMQLTASLCGDVTGDGIPELLLSERTEGAHCCYTYYVTSLTRPSKLIMTWDKGDSGNGFWPVKLEPGKAWQIESVDLVWPPFKAEEGDPAVSYAGVPGFPIVFDLVGGTYQKRTFAFIDALKKERDEERAACGKRGDCDPYELHEWGMAVMFDEWDTQKEKIIPDPDLREQLDRRAKEMKKRMRAQLGG